jgi:hypothetical protein
MSGALKYAIVQLLSKIIDESGLSQVEFARRLGYPYDIDRGLPSATLAGHRPGT